MRIRRIVLWLSLAVSISGCSIGRSIVLKSARPTFQDAMTSVMRETDIDIARTAMAADLKLIEGLLIASPDDQFLLTLAAQGFAGYAMLFYEPEKVEKAKSLYIRSKNYGMRALAKRNEMFSRGTGRFEDFEKSIQTLKAEDLIAVYWTAYAWSSWINLSRTDPMALAEFSRVRLMMDWVRQHDEDYFFSGVNWFDGVYYSMLPPILGGDAEKSKGYFERAVAATNGDFLLGKLFYAQTYAVQSLNRDLFNRILTDILEYKSNRNPDANLANEVAKIRAKKLMEQADELF